MNGVLYCTVLCGGHAYVCVDLQKETTYNHETSTMSVNHVGETKTEQNKCMSTYCFVQVTAHVCSNSVCMYLLRSAVHVYLCPKLAHTTQYNIYIFF